MQNYVELTENRLSSSGIFSQGLPRWKCSRKFWNICEVEVLNQKNFGIESSSCLCSTTSIGPREAIQRNVFRTPIKSRITRRDARKVIGHSLDQERKRSSVASLMVQRFTETGHPIFKGISALSRGILKRKHNRDTVHFNADSSNSELLFRIIRSATELSIYGAVSDWCEEFGQEPNETETSETFETTERTLKEVRPLEVN